MSKITKNKVALLALAGLGAVASGPVLAGGMTVDSKGGLEVFETDENNYWFKIGGRMFFDHVSFDSNDNGVNSSFPSGSHIGSARVTLKGGVGDSFVYKLDLDAQDKAGSVGLGIGDAFIGYAGCKDLWFALGQVSLPFGLENSASPNDLPFMESSLATSAFAPKRGLGLYTEWHGNMITAAGGLYNPRAGSQNWGDVVPAAGGVLGAGPDGSEAGSDDAGIAGRLTFSPLHDDYTVYHAGVSARWEKFHEHSNFLNYVAEMEIQGRQTPYAFTNIPANSTKDHSVWGAELAGRWGQLLVQGEYMLARANRDAFFPALDTRLPGGDLKFHGYHVSANYVLTGEVKDYDFESGSFGAVHPSSRKGAWEIGIRHSFVDLLDNPQLARNAYPVYLDTPLGITGTVKAGIPSNSMVGSVHSTTIGLTWWLNDNVRFLANYIRTELPGSDVDGLGLRAQVNW